MRPTLRIAREEWRHWSRSRLAWAAAALFGIAEVANWRRNNRRDVEQVGFMPWRGIALASAAVALFATAFWLGGR